MEQQQLNTLQGYPEIMNPKMISEYLNIGYVKTLSLLKTGTIPCIRIGNAFKIPKKSLIAWLEEPGLRKLLQK